MTPLTPATFDEMISVLNRFLRHNSEGQKLWDVLTCLRGPDTPSETMEMSGPARDKAYRGRRIRKYNTVEIIRAATFPGVGSARSHSDTKVTLPPHNKWDHFDGHVSKAAHALGIKVEIKDDAKEVRY